ncbi:hypothetical protein [Rhizobium phage RHph_X2_26]|nr:hypothetical protein [Rhizobium phage RHph_X2_26]
MTQVTEKQLKAMIAKLRAEFGKFDKLSIESSEKIGALLDRCSDEALFTAYYAKIRFVSGLALNRIIRRGLADKLKD